MTYIPKRLILLMAPTASAQPVLWFSYVPQAIAVTYANTYGRFSVLDNYERLRYCLALANKNRPVHVCRRAGTPGDEPMAFRLCHGLQDALRDAPAGGCSRRSLAARNHLGGPQSGGGNNSSR
jgi:hypothetical protein